MKIEAMKELVEKHQRLKASFDALHTSWCRLFNISSDPSLAKNALATVLTPEELNAVPISLLCALSPRILEAIDNLRQEIDVDVTEIEDTEWLFQQPTTAQD